MRDLEEKLEEIIKIETELLTILNKTEVKHSYVMSSILHYLYHNTNDFMKKDLEEKISKEYKIDLEYLTPAFRYLCKKEFSDSPFFSKKFFKDEKGTPDTRKIIYNISFNLNKKLGEILNTIN